MLQHQLPTSLKCGTNSQTSFPISASLVHAHVPHCASIIFLRAFRLTGIDYTTRPSHPKRSKSSVSVSISISLALIKSPVLLIEVCIDRRGSQGSQGSQGKPDRLRLACGSAPTFRVSVASCASRAYPLGSAPARRQGLQDRQRNIPSGLAQVVQCQPQPGSCCGHCSIYGTDTTSRQESWTKNPTD